MSRVSWLQIDYIIMNSIVEIKNEWYNAELQSDPGDNFIIQLCGVLWDLKGP